MKNIRTVFFYVIAFFALLNIVSCGEKDPIESKVEIQVKSVLPEKFKGLEGLKALKIEVRDLRTNRAVEYSVNDAGEALLKLDPGTYTILVRGTIEDKDIIGISENFTVKEKEELRIELLVQRRKAVGFVFGEVFFNGETNKGTMMHPDQYFTIFNNSDKTLYADGLSFGLSAHGNWGGEDPFTQALDDKIVLSMIYTLPGSGNDYPVKPGEQVVIAATAQNHKTADRPNAVDLTGADFEAYDPDSRWGDTDNPEVPNLIAHFATKIGFMMHPRGPNVPVLFRVEEDMDAFLAKNQFEYKSANDKVNMLYSIPTDLVIDAIETANEGTLKRKSLPATIDRGYIGVSGCHRQELVARKRITRNGRVYCVDTNDSSNDCEIIKGQNSFPKR